MNGGLETMFSWLYAFPRHCRDGFALGRRWACRPQRVIVHGMGGSGYAGDALWALAGASGPEVTVCRGQVLPAGAYANALAVYVSYSGTTRETLLAWRSTAQYARTAVTLSSVPSWEGSPRHLQLPPGLVPRAAAGYLVMALVGLCAPALGMTPAAVEAAIGEAEAACCRWRDPGNRLLVLARALVGRVPVLVGAGKGGAALARRGKNQLCENAKVPAFYLCFPESAHNDVESWPRIVPENSLRYVFLSLPGQTVPAAARRLVPAESSSMVKTAVVRHWPACWSAPPSLTI
jgi:glucose/mannose-6-phosphate isomerase